MRKLLSSCCTVTYGTYPWYLSTHVPSRTGRATTLSQRLLIRLGWRIGLKAAAFNTSICHVGFRREGFDSRWWHPVLSNCSDDLSTACSTMEALAIAASAVALVAAADQASKRLKWIKPLLSARDDVEALLQEVSEFESLAKEINNSFAPFPEKKA